MAVRMNKEKTIAATAAILFALALGGCDKDETEFKGNAIQASESAAPTAEATPSPEASPIEETVASVEPSPEATPTLSPIEAYWKEFAPTIAMKQDLYGTYEVMPLEYDVEGLRNEDPLIRWFCAYQMLDHADRLTDTDRQALAALMNDEDNDVVSAATYVNGVLTGDYEAGGVSHTSDGKTAAYLKFREARYNPGIVYLKRDGKAPEIMFSDPSVGAVAFSPNDRYLLISNGGRIWNVIHVYDLKKKVWLQTPSMIDALFSAPGKTFKDIDPKKVDPTYQWVFFNQWSPTGDRFLYSYHFGADQQDYDGYAIFDVKKNAVTKVMPLTPESNPLTDFKWPQ